MGCAAALLMAAWVAAVMVGGLGTASIAPLGRHLFAAQPALHVLDARRISHGLVIERDRAADRRTRPHRA
jgi:hypothetical protein